MKVLLDHNMPVQLVPLLPGHEVLQARKMAWDRLSNGDLLRAAERAAFEVMITADKGILYQQNNLLRVIALVIPSTNYLLELVQDLDPILAAIARARPGRFERVSISPSPNPPARPPRRR